jgi:hypothetical protein
MRRAALLIGTQRYPKCELSELISVRADIKGLSKVLRDPNGGRYTVKTIREKPAHVVQRAIDDFFSEADADDLLLLYFSCHGLKDDAGSLFFAASNTDLNRLASTTVSDRYVHEQVHNSRCRRVFVVLDCCYAGVFGASGLRRSIDRFDALTHLSGRGTAVLASSTARQQSFDHLESEHGVTQMSPFTRVLVRGLEGAGDLNRDGLIEAAELYEYVRAGVTKLVPGQTPVFRSEVEGPLYVADVPLARRGAARGTDVEHAQGIDASRARVSCDGEVALRLVGQGEVEAAGPLASRRLRSTAMVVTPRAMLKNGQQHWTLDVRPVENGFDAFAQLVRSRWPEVRLMPAVGHADVDWLMELPRGRAFGGALLAMQLHIAATPGDHCVVVDGSAVDRVQTFCRSAYRGLVACRTDIGSSPGFAIVSKAEARRQVRDAGRLMIPDACALDDLTYGVLWAHENLDEALQADDVELRRRQAAVRPYSGMRASATSHALARDLSAIGQMWLGSDFCARYIMRDVEAWQTPPVFLTKETTGEEASLWLLVRHKVQYLRSTGPRFATQHDRSMRMFCIQEADLRGTAAADRILILLAVALMESFGIDTRVCVEPSLASARGFALEGRKHAVIANWVHADGVWEVDSLRRGATVREMADQMRAALLGCASVGDTTRERLMSLADYLAIDWPWLQIRCHELATVGWERLLQPRSRRLTIDGVNRACRFIAKLK